MRYLMQPWRVAVARPARRMSRREERSYPEYLAGTKAGAAIKPVIIPEFVDLDPFATVGRLQVQRHDPAGNGRLVTPGLSRMSVRRCECHLQFKDKFRGGGEDGDKQVEREGGKSGGGS